MVLQPGTRLRDYEIISLIGTGGMGEVYKAKELTLDREVAIKVLTSRGLDDPLFLQRFVNEAKIHARLSHSNIVDIYAFFEEAKVHYIAMQYAPGITLTELIRTTGLIPEPRALAIFRQICEALAYAHARGVVHRDVKPSNVMVDPEDGDRVKVMDFGIARLLGAQHITRTGTQMGTVCYMSPEQVLGEKEIDHRSDIYSAGVLLYEMLTGILPYNLDTESLFKIQNRILQEPLPDPREAYPHISDGTVALLRSFTQKEREDRPGEILMNGERYESMQQPQITEAKSQHILHQNTDNESNVVTKPSVHHADQMSICTPEMIYVEGGSFNMGSNDGDSDEKPVHKVTVSSFYIGKYEVTQKEWRDLMGTSPSYFKGDYRPVETVSWYDVIEYCNLRSRKEGLTPCYTIDAIKIDPNNTNSSDYLKWSVSVNWQANGYRLPTEAEWEYAARGGNKSKGYKYSGSNDLGTVAWYYDNARAKGDKNSDYGTHKAGTKAANELGIHDMSGNVWEWCWDWRDDGYGYYGKSQSSDPIGAGSGSYRVLRGGSWYYSGGVCRVSYRDGLNPGFGNSNIGFRVVRAIF